MRTPNSNLQKLPNSKKLRTPNSELRTPEEEIWLNNQLSPHTRRAYKRDIQDFMNSCTITSREELRGISRAMVLAWRRGMEEEGVRPRTIRRRLAALSSLFDHYIERGVVDNNPVRGIKRPKVERSKGATPAFSSQEAAEMLELPSGETLVGLRDRAILSVLFQGGLRRSEVAKLQVKSFCRVQGYDALQFAKKGGADHVIVLHPQTTVRIREYLKASGHGEDLEGALFRSVKKNNWRNSDQRRFLSEDRVNEIVKKYAKMIGIERGYSAHSCRSTFITEALKNTKIEYVQQTVGHADVSTTKGYDRSEFDPEKSATFFVNYK